MKEIIVNAQWQGGGDTNTYYGANELIDLYLSGHDFRKLFVSLDKDGAAAKANGIIGFEILRKQIHDAYNLLSKKAPDKVFTLGGGCDADVPSIVYLNKKYRGDLTVLWMDAHGDLNTPEESSSSLFYGMPLRSVMDESCFGLLESGLPLKSTQVIHIGGRDLDEAEQVFIKTSKIQTYSVKQLQDGMETLNREIEQSERHHLYVHLDLDVLDPSVFPHTPLPVAAGLYREDSISILKACKDKLVGIGIYEYISAGKKLPVIEELMQFGISL